MSRQPSSDGASDDESRRTFLRGTAALGLWSAVSLAGCTASGDPGSGDADTDTETGTPTATDPQPTATTAEEPTTTEKDENEAPSFPDWVLGSNARELVDARGRESVTVAVGAGPEDIAFDPALLWVDPGTEVTFEWVSEDHNVVPKWTPEGSDWSGVEPLYDGGKTHSHTFEAEGIYLYACRPHTSIGQRGGIAVGSDLPLPAPEEPLEGTHSGKPEHTGTPTGNPEDTGTPTEDFEGPEWMRGVDNFEDIVDRTGESGVEVLVGAEGNGGGFAFSPPAVAVDPGTEVRWRWVSTGHNLVPKRVPDGSDWDGHSPLEDEGHSYSHVFEQPGDYEYRCQPHEALEMKGLVRVEE